MKVRVVLRNGYMSYCGVFLWLFVSVTRWYSYQPSVSVASARVSHVSVIFTSIASERSLVSRCHVYLHDVPQLCSVCAVLKFGCVSVAGCGAACC